MDSNTELQFLAALQSRNLEVSEGKQLVADGNWQRCTATNKRHRNSSGSYLLCEDGPLPFGLFRNWTDGKDVDYWRGVPSRALTETERQELDRWQEDRRRSHEKE